MWTIQLQLADGVITDAATSLPQLIAYFGLGTILLALMIFLVWKLVQNWQQGLLLEVARLREDVTSKDAKIADIETRMNLRMEVLDSKIKTAGTNLDTETEGRRVAEREIARLQLAIMRVIPTSEADKILGDRPPAPGPSAQDAITR